MCSIMGFYGKTISQDKFSEGFEKTVSRGPDMSRVIGVDGGILGFHRLSIMGLDESGMQPFTLDGDYAVCNGELYGFRKLKKELEERGYTFRSPTANFFSRFTMSTGRKCSKCSTRNLPASYTTVKLKNS